jgi:hypothetical protein
VVQATGTSHDTGTTTTAAVESVTNSLLSNPFMVVGNVNFANSTTAVVNFPVAYTNTGTYTCTVTDASATGTTFFVSNTSNQEMTITASGTISHTVNFNCVGY